jgi:NAD-dependent DNA ligase
VSALEEIKSWKRRHEKCNGFSKNYYRDGSNVLEDNYDEIIEALEDKEEK